MTTKKKSPKPAAPAPVQVVVFRELSEAEQLTVVGGGVLRAAK